MGSGACSRDEQGRSGRTRPEGQGALLGPCLVDPGSVPGRHRHGLLDAGVQGLPVPMRSPSIA
jgi:hypothetical protein